MNVTDAAIGDELTEDDDFSDPEAFTKLGKELLARCKSAGLESKEEKDEEGHCFSLSLPCGRDKRWIYFWHELELKRILAFEFEAYRFLGNYEAIFHSKLGIAEACIQTLRGPGRGNRFYSLLKDEREEGDEVIETPKPLVLQGTSGSTSHRVTFGQPSEALKALISRRRPNWTTLLIEGLPTNQHDAVTNLVERLAGSLFFQIDALYDTPLALERRRRPMIRGRSRTESGASLEFPAYEYDPAPLSLYFYARSAVGLPLVQFLAYYQVVEFYFPVCYQAEAGRRIRAILKNPAFRAERDTDITRIIDTLVSGGGTGYADERSMLKATLKESVDPTALRQYIEIDSDALTFFKSKTKGLTDHRLSMENESLDLCDEVARRIYDIRCRIVHTKASGRDEGYELLLPSSPEAHQLGYDIDLLQYIARQVLVSRSSQFKFEV